MNKLSYATCTYCAAEVALNLDHPAHRIPAADQTHVVVIGQPDQRLIVSGADDNIAQPCPHLIWTYGTVWPADRQQCDGERYVEFNYFGYHADFDADPSEILFHIADDGTYEDVLPSYDDVDYYISIISPRRLSIGGWAVFAPDPTPFVAAVKDLLASVQGC